MSCCFIDCCSCDSPGPVGVGEKEWPWMCVIYTQGWIYPPPPYRDTGGVNKEYVQHIEGNARICASQKFTCKGLCGKYVL